MIYNGQRLPQPVNPRNIKIITVTDMDITEELRAALRPVVPENHRPGSMLSRSRYGIKNNPVITSIGMSIPPENAEYDTSSWTPKKYQGDFAGFSGNAGFAILRNGASI